MFFFSSFFSFFLIIMITDGTAKSSDMADVTIHSSTGVNMDA